MKKEVKKFLTSKKNILITILTLCISIFVSMRIQFNTISFSKILDIDFCFFLLCFSILLFIVMHFIYRPKNVYKFLYQYRYQIGLYFFIILVLGKFHATSIGVWNHYIQPNYDYSSDVFITQSKEIRSDEWLVNTPLMFAQSFTNFAINNPLLRAYPTNVFLLSTAPVLDLIVISRPLAIGMMFLGNEYGISIWWFGRVFLLFFTTFELLMILTKQKKKVSLLGAILVLGSSVIEWFFAAYIVEILIGGQLTLILFDRLFQYKEKWKKVLCSLFLGIAFLDYCLILYPAHQIPFGYIFVLIGIYLLIKNWKLPNFKKDLRYLILPIILIIIVLARFFIVSKEGISIISSTVYPGHRFINGGSFTEWERLLQTPFTLLLPFKTTGDACTISSFLCLFPLPFLLAIFYLVKQRKNMKEKQNILLVSLTLLAIVYFLFCLFPLPDFFVKYTMLSKTTVNAICAPLGYIGIILLCTLFDKITFQKNYQKVLALIVSIGLTLINLYVSYHFMPDYASKKIIIILGVIFIILYYCYLTHDKSWKKYIFTIIIGIITFVNITYVNPLTKGADMIYKKPLAKEIQKIVSKDKDARFIALDSFITPNYLMMNGAKTINSTNIYPNLKQWRKVDSNKKNEDIYNRYAHIVITLTDKKTEFELIQADLFSLHLNYNDITKLDVDYIYTNNEIKLEDDYNIDLKEVYHEDGPYIYKVIEKKS